MRSPFCGVLSPPRDGGKGGGRHVWPMTPPPAASSLPTDARAGLTFEWPRAEVHRLRCVPPRWGFAAEIPIGAAARSDSRCCPISAPADSPLAARRPTARHRRPPMSGRARARRAQVCRRAGRRAACPPSTRRRQRATYGYGAAPSRQRASRGPRCRCGPVRRAARPLLSPARSQR
jgi:hypothetical protein